MNTTRKIISFVCVLAFVDVGAVIIGGHGRRLYTNSKYAYPIKNTYFEQQHGPEKAEYYSYPHYEFEYIVSDKKTGDHKKHKESRNGDNVKGEYSLVEPDGNLRKVSYQANDKHGFNAYVSKAIHKHGDHAISIVGQSSQFGSHVDLPPLNDYLKYKETLKKFNLNDDISLESPIKDEIKPTMEEIMENIKSEMSEIKKMPTMVEINSPVKTEMSSSEEDDNKLNMALDQMRELIGSKMMTSIINSLVMMAPQMNENKFGENIATKPLTDASVMDNMPKDKPMIIDQGKDIKDAKSSGSSPASFYYW